MEDSKLEEVRLLRSEHVEAAYPKLEKDEQVHVDELTNEIAVNAKRRAVRQGRKTPTGLGKVGSRELLVKLYAFLAAAAE